MLFQGGKLLNQSIIGSCKGEPCGAAFHRVSALCTRKPLLAPRAGLMHGLVCSLTRSASRKTVEDGVVAEVEPHVEPTKE